MLLHVVHPHVFKSPGGVLRIGAFPEGEERNQKVKTIVNATLQRGQRILVHDFNPGYGPQPPLHHRSLESDPILSIIYHPGIDVVVTMGDGFPLPDEIPAMFHRMILSMPRPSLPTTRHLGVG